MSKQRWLEISEIIDSLRIIPRLVLLGYLTATYHFINIMLQWYFVQPMAGRGAEETSLCVAVITAITGMASWVFKVYSDNGRDWNLTPQVSTTSASTTTTIQKTEAP